MPLPCSPLVFVLIRIRLEDSGSIVPSSLTGDRLRVTSGTENFRPQNRAAYSSGNTISHSFEAPVASRFHALTSRINSAPDTALILRALYPLAKLFFWGTAYILPDSAFTLTRTAPPRNGRAWIIPNAFRIWKGNDSPGWAIEKVSRSVWTSCRDNNDSRRFLRVRFSTFFEPPFLLSFQSKPSIACLFFHFASYFLRKL